jgi:hypothetical protein
MVIYPNSFVLQKSKQRQKEDEKTKKKKGFINQYKQQLK